ncbi:MAG: hypothetical protein ACRCZF_06180, partial [Gemmataceae bacterium]
MNVDIAELSTISKRLMDHIVKRLDITSADITLESYWLVADSCRNRSDWSDAELINTLELGSLTEDLDTLR